MAPSQPKPEEADGDFENIMKKIDHMNNEQIQAGPKIIALKMSDRHPQWLSDVGQAELLRQIQDRSKSPPPTSAASDGLGVLDYSDASKVMLC